MPKKCILRRLMTPTVSLGTISFLDPILLCGVLFLLLQYDAGGWLRLSLLASLLHESGHVFAYALILRRAPHIDVTLTGFCLHTAGLLLAPKTELWIAAAGPAANLAMAGGLYLYLEKAHATVFLFGFLWANLLVGGFNLLPIPPLDGWTIVRLAIGEKLQFGRK